MRDRRAKNGSQKANMGNFPECVNLFDMHGSIIIGYFLLNVGIAAYGSNGSKKMCRDVLHDDLCGLQVADCYGCRNGFAGVINVLTLSAACDFLDTVQAL